MLARAENSLVIYPSLETILVPQLRNYGRHEIKRNFCLRAAVLAHEMMMARVAEVFIREVSISHIGDADYLMLSEPAENAVDRRKVDCGIVLDSTIHDVVDSDMAMRFLHDVQHQTSLGS